MVDTTLKIGEFVVYEPMTAFTDYLITIIAFIYFRKLSAENEVIRNWRLFFLFIALSTLLGGTSHALFPIHDGWQYKSFWLPMQIVNGFAVYFAQRATLISVLKNSNYYNAWKLSYLVQLIVYLLVLMIVQKYVVTIIDNALGLIPIMILHLSAKKKEKYYNYIGYGIAVSFITAIVHGLKFSLHAYFNYNDIAHVFIIISLTVMFTGLKKRITS
jgi:hypothetical protein